MRTLRNRRLLATEGFGEADVIEAIEPVEESVAAQVGIVEKDDQETMGLLNEGEILSEDTDTLEGLEDQVAEVEESGEEITPEHAETLELVTEAIASRWVIQTPKRKLAFENFSGRRGATKLVRESIGETLAGAWNAFIEWCEDMLDKIADTYKKYFGAGKAFSSAHEKNTKRLGALGEKKEDKVKAKYQRHFMVDGQLDIDGSIALAKGLPSEAKAVFGWAAEVAAKGEDAIKLARGDAGKFDQVVSGEKKAKVFGKKLSKKLAPVGPKNSNESQEVYALPGNAFLQSFQYYLKGEGEQYKVNTLVDGIRFISSGDSASEAAKGEKEVETLAIDALKSHNEVLKVIGEELTKVETNHKGAREESRKLLAAAKDAAKAAKGEEDKAAKLRLQQAQKVAREGVFSARHSLNAVLHVYKTVGAGVSELVSAHAGAYAKA